MIFDNQKRQHAADLYQRVTRPLLWGFCRAGKEAHAEKLVYLRLIHAVEIVRLPDPTPALGRHQPSVQRNHSYYPTSDGLLIKIKQVQRHPPET